MTISLKQTPIMMLLIILLIKYSLCRRFYQLFVRVIELLEEFLHERLELHQDRDILESLRKIQYDGRQITWPSDDEKGHWSSSGDSNCLEMQHGSRQFRQTAIAPSRYRSKQYRQNRQNRRSTQYRGITVWHSHQYTVCPIRQYRCLSTVATVVIDSIDSMDSIDSQYW